MSEVEGYRGISRRDDHRRAWGDGVSDSKLIENIRIRPGYVSDHELAAQNRFEGRFMYACTGH